MVLARQHDDPSEQPAVYEVADSLVVVMERPCADHVVGDVIGVGPGLAGTDLVGAAPVAALNPERPRAVAIDTVPEAMNGEAVRLGGAVQHVNV